MYTHFDTRIRPPTPCCCSCNRPRHVRAHPTAARLLNTHIHSQAVPPRPTTPARHTEQILSRGRGHNNQATTPPRPAHRRRKYNVASLAAPAPPWVLFLTHSLMSAAAGAHGRCPALRHPTARPGGDGQRKHTYLTHALPVDRCLARPRAGLRLAAGQDPGGALGSAAGPCAGRLRTRSACPTRRSRSTRPPCPS